MPAVAKMAPDRRALFQRLGKRGIDFARIRLAASKLLRIVSQDRPELVYPDFHFLVKLLNDMNRVLHPRGCLA